MPDLDVLFAAHAANERLRLGLTPAQIVKALDRHAGRAGRAKVGRKTYRDDTGDTAAARADRAREQR